MWLSVARLKQQVVDSASSSSHCCWSDLCFPLRRAPPIDHAIRHLEAPKKSHVKAVPLIYNVGNFRRNK